MEKKGPLHWQRWETWLPAAPCFLFSLYEAIKKLFLLPSELGEQGKCCHCQLVRKVVISGPLFQKTAITNFFFFWGKHVVFSVFIKSYALGISWFLTFTVACKFIFRKRTHFYPCSKIQQNCEALKRKGSSSYCWAELLTEFQIKTVTAFNDPWFVLYWHFKWQDGYCFLTQAEELPTHWLINTLIKKKI